MKNFIKNNDQEWVDLGAGVSRQILGFNEDLMQVKVRFLKGATGSVHRHSHTQCSFVASGKFEVNINGEQKILGTGDGFFAEPNVAHGVICLEEGILLDTFTPARKDFL